MSDERMLAETTEEQTGKRPLEDTELTDIVGGVGQDPPPSGPPVDTGRTPDDDYDTISPPGAD